MESDYIPSHGHPATFNRIATILDVIAGSQAEHADEMAEIRKLQAQQERTLAKHAAAMEEMRVRHDAAWERIDRAMEKLTLKSAETEEKLNALISMFDQHLNDHHNNDRRNR
jgi:septal ring factor EnvC (AmiA/AmiB activator)